MNDQQRTAIRKLRHGGLGYKAISAQLDLPLSTVKSFCRRNDLAGDFTAGSNGQTALFCKECGKKLKQTQGARMKVFCSDACRLAWWQKNPDKVKRRANYELTCQFCNQIFISYGNKHRKYCCHACYIADRYGGDRSD